jgi:bacillithiol biosynthesis cysteine-adding enzyme BshC
VTTSGLSSTTTRLPIDIRRFPWINRLAADYAHDFARLAPFFAGNPDDPAAWRDAIARARQHARSRDAIADLIAAQQQRRGAPAEARAAAARLRDAQAVAVVTGQQAGLFGGPLYTLLKAMTAVELAARVASEQGVEAIAVFWVDAEDHDWDEVRSVNILGDDDRIVSVDAGSPPGSGAGRVADVRLDASIEQTMAALEQALPATPSTPDVVAMLRSAYQAGTGMADAFARLIETVLGPLGLVVFESADAAAKPLARRAFLHELNGGHAAQRAIEAGDRLTALGYHAQVTPQADQAALFHLDGGRHAVSVGDAAMRARAEAHPEEFSPNVLLRPIVQDILFPTICYVAGPSEVAYFGQLRGVYEAFGVPMPLVYPRATATILDSNAMRFLQRTDVPFESLRAQDEAALNQLLEAQLPASVERTLEEAAQAVADRMEALAAAVPQIDATLEGAARSTLGRMQDDLKKLHGKIIQAAKRKDETLRRQFTHARAQAFPGGDPQERTIGFVSFLNKYGPAFVDRLREDFPLDTGTHWVITI